MEWLKPLLSATGLIKFFFWLKDRFWPNGASAQENESVAVARRFVELFEAHGVARNQIPDFFGHGLTLAKLKDNETLLEQLNGEMLKDACELFAVRREWLDGVDNSIYDVHDFYKYPERFDQFLDTLEARHPLSVYNCVALQIKPSQVTNHTDCVFYVSEPIGTVGDKEIYRHHLCGNWYLHYWKSRGYFAACAALAWKRELHMRGVFVDSTVVSKFDNGFAFVREAQHYGQHWYPENFASVVDDYMRGFKRGSYEYSAAIQHWLELHQQGWMDFGHGDATKMASELGDLLPTPRTQ